ncbi:MAG: FAD-dependent oxidoreductase [Aggregatilineales bacterium]
MFETHVSTDVLIIGAGISGLMAAQALQEKGVKVIVVDKGRSVGGRLATRRIGDGVADHGAQFFTVREPEFQTYVEQWVNDRVVYVWAFGWSDGSLQSPSPEQGNPRYAAYGGMNNLPKHLAKDIEDVRLNVKIVTATRDEEGWVFQDEEGNIYASKALIMTAPVPQSLQILNDGATALADKDKVALEEIEYFPSLTGMFLIEGRVTLPLPGAVQRKNANISWIADNKVKGISPNATLVTVQANDQYSQNMWSAPDERVLNALHTDLNLYLDDNAVVKESQLKRWRYATPTSVYPERCLVAQGDLSLVFAGDAFGGPRIEGAALSGLAASEAITRVLA